MKAVLQHLRFAFSFLLLPVFLFSLYTIRVVNFKQPELWLLLIILHVLVYPASNAYNSTQDRDKGSVGLIKDPLPVPKNLLQISVGMDLAALLLSLFLPISTTVLLAVYIGFSRLYSWRKVRLKQYPYIGFLTVFLFQGALIYYTVLSTLSGVIQSFSGATLMAAFTASLFIGSIYPLSQIYQHQQDLEDGVVTISATLGFRNTFLFSGAQFLLATVLFSYSQLQNQHLVELMVWLACQLPVVLFFMYWFMQVMKNSSAADYRHAMRMNLIAAVAMNLSFLLLLAFGK